jgi:hypothetical protein
MTTKQILNIMKPFTDKKNPKPELWFIYYNSEKNILVSTDTRRLLIIEPNIQLYDKNCFIDINKTNIGSKPEVFNEDVICFEEKQIGSFPKIDKIWQDIKDAEKNRAITGDYTLADIVMNIGSFTEERILIKYTKQYNILEKVNLNVYNIRYSKPDVPIGIIGSNDNFELTLIIMPMKEV